MSDRTKLLLAIILPVLLIFTVIKQLGDHSTRKVSSDRDITVKTIESIEIPELHQHQFDPNPVATSLKGQSIFEYGQPPPDPDELEKQRQREELLRQREEQKAQRLRQQHQAKVTPETPSKPVPPPINFKYLGSFGPRGRMLAVILNDEQILDVFEGDIFMEKFIVKNIGLETLEVGFVGFPDDEIQKVEVGS